MNNRILPNVTIYWDKATKLRRPIERHLTLKLLLSYLLNCGHFAFFGHNHNYFIIVFVATNIPLRVMFVYQLLFSKCGYCQNKQCPHTLVLPLHD